MQDGPVRRALKRVALANFTLGLGLSRAFSRWRRERAWVLGGDCRRCAECCEAPAIQVGSLVWHVPALRGAFLVWQEHVNGFRLSGRQRHLHVFVFECTHFDRATRSCDSYDSRPGMCRDYPRLLLHQANPEFLPGCGYRAAPPNATGLRLSLARAPLSDQQRRALEKGLRIDKP
jgi:hypothetical protein